MKSKKIGTYIIHENDILGKGQFSIVFKGINQLTKEQVAIKKISKFLDQRDIDNKKYLQREISIMKQLKSSNIIKLIDTYVTKNNFYIVQEFAEGGTLANIIKQRKNIPEQVALVYCQQMLSGFVQLLKNGIVHKDLKPENILIKNGILKIADFGFSQQCVHSTLFDDIEGTPFYMAPQILMKQHYTYKCDIWSLGVIIYEMLIGKIPWNFNNIYNPNQMFQHINITFPQHLNISPNIKNFILKCLKVNEQDRLDWADIYSHPLFANHFENHIQYLNKGDPIQMVFFMDNVKEKLKRDSLNINIFLNKFEIQINQDQFVKIFKQIIPQCSKNSLKILYYHCLKDKKHLEKQSLMELLAKYGIYNKKIFTIKNCVLKQKINFYQNEQAQTQLKAKELLNRLINQISMKKVNIYQAYKHQDKHKRNQLKFQQFTSLLNRIDKSWKQDQIQILFKQFDISNVETINFKTFFGKLMKNNLKLQRQ